MKKMISSLYQKGWEKIDKAAINFFWKKEESPWEKKLLDMKFGEDFQANNAPDGFVHDNSLIKDAVYDEKLNRIW